jgi:hypothetical protein
VYTPRPESSRKSWQKNGTDLASLENKPIMSQTKAGERAAEEPLSARKAWGLPHETVLEALQLADLTNSGNSDEIEKTSKAKVVIAPGRTFLVGKASARSGSSSGSSNMLMNEKPPSIIDKLDSMEATVRKLADIITPERLATMKQTNNFLFGVTLGQFDLKNTKVK